MAQLSVSPNAAKDGDKPVKMQSQGKVNQVLVRREKTMQIRTKKDLAEMLMKRDHVTLAEAKHMIAVTQQLLNECFEEEVGSLTEVENILYDYLGIELDYIYLFI